jgi:hypothetical protein
MASSNVNETVQQALAEGHPWEDIKSYLSTLNDPEVKSYLAGVQAPAQQFEEPKRDNLTKALDWVQENPGKAAGIGAAVYGATQLPKIVSGIADYRLEKRKVDLKERSLAAYEAQVAKQGAVPELVNSPDDLINNVRQNEFDQLKTAQSSTPTVQDQIAQERLRQAQLKTQRAEVEHQNWLAKNTLTEAEQAFGRKAKDPAELRLMQTAVQQQAGKGSVAPTTAGPAPMAELQVTQAAPAPVAPANVAPTPVPPPPAAPVETTPAITQPANVVSSGATPAQAEAPIKQAEVIKQVTTPTVAKAPVEPTTFRPDLGPGDNWLYNTAGPEKRKAILKEFNDGKPAGSYDEAQKLWAKYVESRRETFAGPEMTKEVRKERGIPPRENFGQLGKVAKVGGVAGLALTAAQMAQAAQNRKYTEAALMGADIATDFIPGVAQLKQGLSPSEAGAPGVSSKAFENAALLGSPYAQTEWAKSQRQKNKSNAVVPPSAYLR